MISKLTIALILFLSLLPELAYSQSLPKSDPLTMDIRFNGTEASGTCSRSDSVLTVTASNGEPFQIVTIEMSVGKKYYRSPGSIISSEMKRALQNSRSGDELTFLLKVRGKTGPMRLVAATYFIE